MGLLGGLAENPIWSPRCYVPKIEVKNTPKNPLLARIPLCRFSPDFRFFSKKWPGPKVALFILRPIRLGVRAEMAKNLFPFGTMFLPKPSRSRRVFWGSQARRGGENGTFRGYGRKPYLGSQKNDSLKMTSWGSFWGSKSIPDLHTAGQFRGPGRGARIRA
jgi:hypothetical protein